MRFGIGQSASRSEDARLLTGNGRYTDDINLPGQARACFVRSPHAHARIAGIDHRAARAAPGVIAVFTAKDIIDGGLQPLPSLAAHIAPLYRADGSPLHVPKWHALAPDRARFVGQSVAMVVAETAAQARDAAELVEVDYGALPAVTDTAAAVEPGAPVVWDDCPDNVSFDFRSGAEHDVAAAMARASRVVEMEIPVSRICANPMEPLGAVGSFDPLEERYTLYAGNQMPHVLRHWLATAVLQVPESRVRVVSPDMGGSFGLRSTPFPELVMTLFASRVLGRPVKWIAERGEAMLASDHARDLRYHVSLALDEDGIFLALRVEGVAALGACITFFGPFPAFANLGGLAGPYRTPAIHARVRGVFTHTTPTCPYRGAGRPEASLAIEMIIDRAARELGVDRAALRRRNMIAPEQMPFQTGLNFKYDCGEFEENMNRALAAADYAGFEARRAEARGRGRLRGLGIANTVEASAGFFDEGAEIRFDPGGDVTVLVGTHSHGQGHETVYRQLLADELGLDFEQIRVVQGDTDQVPYGFGTGGSRGASLGGAAVLRATRKVIERGKHLAAHALETAEQDIEFAGGRYTVAGTDRSVNIGELAALACNPLRRPPELEGGLRAFATFKPRGPTFPNGCHVCEVEVDPETGTSAVIAYWVVEDVGTVLNPMLLKAQLQGGIVQGLGQILLERVVWDETGQQLTGSFMDYAMPRADEVPFCHIETHAVPTATNPLGAKGAGEAGTVGGLPCVMNAMLDALAPVGVTTLAMPASPERVWLSIRSASEHG